MKTLKKKEKTMRGGQKKYVWVQKGIISGSNGKDSTCSSSDEEGRKSSGDRASRSGKEKWQTKKTYSAAAQQGKFPDFKKKFILTTDAFGAVLAQGEGINKSPLAFASRKLSPAETRYGTIDRKLLGLIWAIENSKPYLLGRKFIIKRDYKPLVWVDKMEKTSGRISRWKEVLAAYDYEIVHTKGKDNVLADYLSRQVNAIEDVDANYAARYLREWLGEAESDTESEGPWEFTPLPVTENRTDLRQKTSFLIIKDNRKSPMELKRAWRRSERNTPIQKDMIEITSRDDQRPRTSWEDSYLPLRYFHSGKTVLWVEGLDAPICKRHREMTDFH
ncbi:hypothetical protein AAG570_012736 [Ranatra chinensis]|uniref:Reverse transcriptase RNase H-like domain-containing protein n=1 Tax=Ranatra chinensis TaxID=642074 RepID=A0ABD0YR66_9HEMI